MHSSQAGWSQQANVLIMQLLVQLQLQVFLHNQADKHQTLSDVASHPKWCSQKPERRRMIPRKIRGKSTALWGQGEDTQRLWAWCTLHTQNICHSLASYTVMAPRQQQTLDFSWRTLYALTVLQRGREGTYKPPVQQERSQISAECSFLEKNITLQTSLHLKLHFCCLQKQLLLPAPIKHYF